MQYWNKWMGGVFLSMLFILSACSSPSQDEIEELVLGYFPSADVENIAQSAEPLEEYLSEELGVPVRGEVVTNYAGLIEGMANEHVDIAFLPPFAYIQAVERANVDILLKAIRDGAEYYAAQYVVREDSELSSVEEIAENEHLIWSFGDYSSTSGYLFPAQQLLNLGVENLDDSFTMIETGAHDSALLQVLEGEADFATTFRDARVRLDQEIPTIYDELKVIGYTNEIPNATLSVREGLSEDLKQEIKSSFLKINQNDDMLATIVEVYNWEGFAEASPEEYEVVKEVYEEFGDLIIE